MPREVAAGERRVALVPKVVEKLRSLGVDVLVEAGAGLGALIPDEAYQQAGAKIGDPWDADVVVKVNRPTEEEIGKLRSGATLIGFLAPLTDPDTTKNCVTPESRRSQWNPCPGFPARSPWTPCPHKPTCPATRPCCWPPSSTRFFPMLTTAAGTVKPATVLVLGVGVAGLQALATAKRLGARTTGYDVRPEVAEQVRSLGAQWLDIGYRGGRRRRLRSRADRGRTRRAAASGSPTRSQGFDVVITTALVPGRPAPSLVTAARWRGCGRAASSSTSPVRRAATAN